MPSIVTKITTESSAALWLGRPEISSPDTVPAPTSVFSIRVPKRSSVTSTHYAEYHSKTLVSIVSTKCKKSVVFALVFSNGRI